MRLLLLGIELLNVTAVQGQHDADSREHRRAAVRGDQDQRLHRCLPFRGLVLSLRKLGDVIAGIMQGDQLAATGQLDRFIEAPRPGHGSHSRWKWRLVENQILFSFCWRDACRVVFHLPSCPWCSFTDYRLPSRRDPRWQLIAPFRCASKNADAWEAALNAQAGATRH